MTQVKTWVQSSPPDEREQRWLPDELSEPFPVEFGRYFSLYPIYCDLVGYTETKAVLHIPKSSDQVLTDWFPHNDECWIITDLKYIYPQ